MKKAIRSKLLVLVVLLALVWSVTSCGFILYPERRGATGGRVDVVVVVMDCLWLLAGVVPGVVALVVDLVTGCIYEGGGGGGRRHSINVRPGNEVAFKLRGAAPADANVKVVITRVDGIAPTVTLLDENFKQGDERLGTTILTIPSDLAVGAYKLDLKVNDRETIAWDLQVN